MPQTTKMLPLPLLKDVLNGAVVRLLDYFKELDVSKTALMLKPPDL